uniref:Uncharacterized protein n=1 Tax=Octopus bimaculoides TaxID=37653 RepID=A0A0L8FXY4_OCTBM
MSIVVNCIFTVTLFCTIHYYFFLTRPLCSFYISVTSTTVSLAWEAIDFSTSHCLTLNKILPDECVNCILYDETQYIVLACIKIKILSEKNAA